MLIIIQQEHDLSMPMLHEKKFTMNFCKELTYCLRVSRTFIVNTTIAKMLFIIFYNSLSVGSLDITSS